MKELRIDFAPTTPRSVLYRTRPWTWLLAAAGLALCIGAAMSAAALLEQREAQRLAASKLQASLHQRTAAKPAAKPTTISEAQQIAVNHAIAQLNLPWRDMLDAVESATPKTIALLALEPDAKRSVLRVTAEAKNSDDMLDYVEEMKRQSFLDDVLLVRHEINDKDANRPLRFQLELHWREDAQ
jgi:Tfp pilus assembly protein PilN